MANSVAAKQHKPKEKKEYKTKTTINSILCQKREERNKIAHLDIVVIIMQNVICIVMCTKKLCL